MGLLSEDVRFVCELEPVSISSAGKTDDCTSPKIPGAILSLQDSFTIKNAGLLVIL
jgi:hypothetical protein